MAEELRRCVGDGSCVVMGWTVPNHGGGGVGLSEKRHGGFMSVAVIENW